MDEAAVMTFAANFHDKFVKMPSVPFLTESSASISFIRKTDRLI